MKPIYIYFDEKNECINAKHWALLQNNYLKFICSKILSLKLVLKINWFKFSAGFDFLFSEWGIFAAFTMPEHRIDVKIVFFKIEIEIALNEQILITSEKFENWLRLIK